jgi:hypothetical protein
MGSDRPVALIAYDLLEKDGLICKRWRRAPEDAVRARILRHAGRRHLPRGSPSADATRLGSARQREEQAGARAEGMS